MSYLTIFWLSVLGLFIFSLLPKEVQGVFSSIAAGCGAIVFLMIIHFLLKSLTLLH